MNAHHLSLVTGTRGGQESDFSLGQRSTLRFKVNTKTQSTFSFISELRPHSATVTLYSWIIVIIHGLGDCVTSTEGDAAAPVSCLRAQTRPPVDPLTSTRPGPGLGRSALCCDLAQLFKPSQKQDYLPGWNPSHLSSFLGPVKPRSSPSVPVFSFVNREPEPFPAIRQTQTFIGLTYSPHTLQLHSLMKCSGVQLISLQQYQY